MKRVRNMASGSETKSVVSSDSEMSGDEVTWDDSKNFTLPFGKYKGKSMERMILSGRRRHYLRYLQKWDELMPRTRGHVECALAQYDMEKRENERVAQPPSNKKRKK